MKTHALFIGRFQPPHKGHQKIIKQILQKYSHLKIAIGSSNQKRNQKNPLSAKERLFLLKKIIPKSKKITFAFIPDNSSNKKWVAYVKKRFSTKKYEVFSANPLVRSLLNPIFKLNSSPLFNRLIWEGAKIRNLIRQQKPYSNRIPKEIQKYIKQKEKIIQSKL